MYDSCLPTCRWLVLVTFSSPIRGKVFASMFWLLLHSLGVSFLANSRKFIFRYNGSNKLTWSLYRFEQLRVLHDIPLDLQRGGSIGATQKLSSSLLCKHLLLQWVCSDPILHCHGLATSNRSTSLVKDYIYSIWCCCIVLSRDQWIPIFSSLNIVEQHRSTVSLILCLTIVIRRVWMYSAEISIRTESYLESLNIFCDLVLE